jgi:hypothetical protein
VRVTRSSAAAVMCALALAGCSVHPGAGSSGEAVPPPTTGLQTSDVPPLFGAPVSPLLPTGGQSTSPGSPVAATGFPTSVTPSITGSSTSRNQTTAAHHHGTGHHGTGHHSPAPPPTNPACSARATGQVGGRWRQAIAFTAPGSHQYPDSTESLHACSSSGLPVTFTLAAGAVNCTLSGSQVEATSTPASCVVIASQGGNSEFAPAASVSGAYRVSLQTVSGSWGGPPAGTPLTVSGGLTVTVVITSNGSYQIGDVSLDSSDESVCSSVDVGPISGTGTTSTNVVVPLNAAGTCTLSMSIVGAALNTVNQAPAPRSYTVTD